HTLDAFFNALVVEGLHAAGVEQLVAIHDSWFLSELDGAELLMDTIEDAGPAWMEGLAPVYEWFVTALTGSPYEDFAVGIRARWREQPNNACTVNRHAKPCTGSSKRMIVARSDDALLSESVSAGWLH